MRNIKDLSFEEALDELQNIVKDIEVGKSSLDEMIKKCERGTELRLYCEQKLQEAKLRVDKLNVPSS